MKEKRLITMTIASNILAAYYANKNCYCTVNKKEPDDATKEELLTKVITVFENLCTSYLGDIENIADGVR